MRLGDVLIDRDAGHITAERLDVVESPASNPSELTSSSKRTATQAMQTSFMSS